MESFIDFLEVITALLDEEHPFPVRFLHRFSDLSLVEAKELKTIWKEKDSSPLWKTGRNGDALHVGYEHLYLHHQESSCSGRPKGEGVQSL